MAAIDLSPRHLPCRIFHDHNIPCVVWFEDALAYYGVPTVVFDLYILVPDAEAAAQVLVREGWNLIPQEKGKIGNAYCRLTPPSPDSHKAQPPTSHSRTSNLPPPPDTSPPGPTTTVLLPAADWNFSLTGVDANNTKILGNTIFPPLAGLVDALIDSLLDCPIEQDMLRMHLGVQINYIYGRSPVLKEKAFAEQLLYEHRQYHLDVVSGMEHGTVPFILHQRSIREALRQRTHTLQECSAPNNKDLFRDRELEAKILASMPNPFVHMEGNRKDDGWEVYDTPEENEGNF
ncbi:hypothetical protein N0V90_004337 [Kalmusia sp. IMI 367209]|nr:hypothetical protein N0V90_004337 [Kalmusia sp. IMI 367209]